jgi:hypothetical protein
MMGTLSQCLYPSDVNSIISERHESLLSPPTPPYRVGKRIAEIKKYNMQEL